MITFQDGNGTIENEELRGFLKDLLELVKRVSPENIYIFIDVLNHFNCLLILKL